MDKITDLGEYAAFKNFKNENIKLFIFKDHEKIVRMISTNSINSKMEKDIKLKKSKKIVKKIKPYVSIYYSIFKNSVDRFDQNFLDYFRPRKFRFNAQKCRLFTLFKMVLINAIRINQFIELNYFNVNDKNRRIENINEFDEFNSKKRTLKPQKFYLNIIKILMSTQHLNEIKKIEDEKKKLKNKKNALRQKRFREKIKMNQVNKNNENETIELKKRKITFVPYQEYMYFD
jgi:hypothetical protein